MINNSRNYNIGLSINVEDARRRIEELTNLVQKLEDQKKKALSVGDKQAGDEYAKAIREYRQEIRKNQRDIQAVETVMKNLSGATLKELKGALRSVQAEFDKTPRGTAQYKALAQQMTILRTEISKVNAETKASTSLFSKLGVLANRFQAFIWGAGAAITGLTMTIRSAVKQYADMEEEMANVQKYSGLSSEAVNELNEEFKAMDTRTSREQLNKLAGDAGRLGIQTKEAIKEFVDGADKIQVALGDDLGENAVRDIGKLAQMFGEDQKKGLRGAMLATGSAVNELAQNSSAAGGYIVDFTARLSGVGKQAGLTQAQIMGYGSVLDQNMQNIETSATAVSQLLTKMMQGPAKFAQLANVEVKKFTELLRTDANEALLQFFKAMNAKGGFAELAPMFEGMGLNGSRATGILSVLANKLDDVKKAQKLANDAYDEGTSVLAEFDRMNTTVEAGIEKATKAFKEMAIELGKELLPVVKYTISGTSLLTRALSTIIGFIKQHTAAIIAAGVALVAFNAELIILAVRLKALTIIETVSKLVKGFNAALKANPAGATAAAISILVGVIVDLVNNMNKAVDIQKIFRDINKKVNSEIAAEEANVRVLIATINDENVAQTVRKEKLDELNNILRNNHLPAITEEEIRTGKVNDRIREYISLTRQRIRISTIQTEIEESIKRQVQYEEEIKKLKELKNNQKFRSANPTKWAGLDKEISKYEEKIAKELEKQAKFEKEIADTQKKTDAVPSKTTNSTHIKSVKQQIAETRALIAQLKKDIANLRSGKTVSDDIVKAIEEKTKELKAAESKLEVLTGSKTETKVSSSSSGKTDTKFNKETTAHDNQMKADTQKEIAELMARYAKGEVLAREYQDKLYSIQERGLEDRIAYLNTRDIDKAHALQDDLEKLRMQHNNKIIAIDETAIDQQQKAREIKLREMYIDENSEIYMNQQALNEALFNNDLEALKSKQALYARNTDEWLQYENEISNMENQHALDLKEQYYELLNSMREKYGKMDFEQQRILQENGLKALHQAGLISEKEYQEMLLELKKEYASKSLTLNKFDKSVNSAYTTASAAGAKASEGKTNPFSSSIASWKTSMQTLKQLYENDQITFAEYQQAKAQINADTIQEMMTSVQSMYNAINNIMSAASSYYSACQSYELAVLEKKYDAEIEKAGDNQKKIKKIEEKKEKEEAAIKSEYNEKAMKIEIAQAYASMAMSAINAYSSAASIPKVGWIMAPIAAAAAIAAGMLQIETIKKQHAAEEAGYYEGGFTGGSKYRREAGVVHEGEFVANHNAVNNPSIMPVLNLIDRAQKNNTVGRLTAADVSRSVGAESHTVIVNTDNSKVVDIMERLKETTDTLNAQLAEGITAIAAIDGPNGIAKQLNKYNKLLNYK